MNVGQLEAFVAVAEELQFRRAAQKLSASTPNLSKRIADLERELGVQLFERTSHSVRLTAVGGLLLDGATRALAEVQHLRRIASSSSGGLMGAIRIAYSPGTGQTMARLVRKLRSSDLDVTVQQLISLQVLEAVQSGQVTVGICRAIPTSDLNALLLLRSPRNLVVMPIEHHLSALKALRTADLEGEVLIHPDASINVLGSAGEFPDLPGVHIHSRSELVLTETELLDRVAAGFGLALISAHYHERNHRNDLVALPVVDLPFEPRDETRLIWRERAGDHQVAVSREQPAPDNRIRRRDEASLELDSDTLSVAVELIKSLVALRPT